MANLTAEGSNRSSRARTTSLPEGRVRLRLDDVVAAAEVLVERHGWDQLTMTALASQVGVRTPSLYCHVAGLDALRALIQARTIARLGRSLRSAAMGRSTDDGFRRLAVVHREFALAHPRCYEGATRAPIDREAFLAASEDANEALQAMVTSYGLTGEAALYVELAMFAAVHGFVALEIAGFFGDAVDADRVFALVVEGALQMVAGRPLAAKAASRRGGARAARLAV